MWLHGIQHSTGHNSHFSWWSCFWCCFVVSQFDIFGLYFILSRRIWSYSLSHLIIFINNNYFCVCHLPRMLCSKVLTCLQHIMGAVYHVINCVSLFLVSFFWIIIKYSDDNIYYGFLSYVREHPASLGLGFNCSGWIHCLKHILLRQRQERLAHNAFFFCDNKQQTALINMKNVLIISIDNVVFRILCSFHAP